MIEKGQDKNIEQQLEIPDTISAPIEQGEVLGTIVYRLNGEEIENINIIAEKSVKRNSAFHMIEYVYTKWFSLFRT